MEHVVATVGLGDEVYTSVDPLPDDWEEARRENQRRLRLQQLSDGSDTEEESE